MKKTTTIHSKESTMCYIFGCPKCRKYFIENKLKQTSICPFCNYHIKTDKLKIQFKHTDPIMTAKVLKILNNQFRRYAGATKPKKKN